MAEIVRTHVVVTRQALLMGDLSGPEKRTTDTTIVRSIRTGVVDVSILRNLVAALDEAGIPGQALVTADHSQEGYLVQLTVRHEVDLIEDEPETCGGER